MRIWLAAMLLVGCVACSDAITGPSGVTLVVEGAPGQSGDTLTVRLSNASTRPLEYNLCAAGLERRFGTSWESVQKLPEGAGCLALALLLQPGESGDGPLILYPFIVPGSYRLRAAVRIDENEYDVVSGIFEVVES